MDAETRKLLADALREATPEMLRDDAGCMIRDAARCRVLVPDDERPMLYRLAALSLAVAEMQEGGHSAASAGADEGESVHWVAFADGQSSVHLGPFDALAVTDWGIGNGHPTLPAALAALIVEGA
jgi:hypothetical protein